MGYLAYPIAGLPTGMHQSLHGMKQCRYESLYLQQIRWPAELQAENSDSKTDES